MFNMRCRSIFLALMFSVQCTNTLQRPTIGEVGRYSLATSVIAITLLNFNRGIAWYEKWLCTRRLQKVTPEVINQHMQTLCENVQNPTEILKSIHPAFGERQIGSIIHAYLVPLPLTNAIADTNTDTEPPSHQEIPEHPALKMLDTGLPHAGGIGIQLLVSSARESYSAYQDNTADYQAFLQALVQFIHEPIDAQKIIPPTQDTNLYGPLNEIVQHEQHSNVYEGYRSALNNINQSMSGPWLSGLRYLAFPVGTVVYAGRFIPSNITMIVIGTALWALNEVPVRLIAYQNRTSRNHEKCLRNIGRCRGRQVLLDLTTLLCGTLAAPFLGSGVLPTITWLGIHGTHAYFHLPPRRNSNNIGRHMIP